jgi:UDP-glucuronate decarboxylase
LTRADLQEYAEIILKLTGSKSKITYVTNPSELGTEQFGEGMASDRTPDITIASSHLKWAPQKDFVRSLNATINYFRERLLAVE